MIFLNDLSSYKKIAYLSAPFLQNNTINPQFFTNQMAKTAKKEPALQRKFFLKATAPFYMLTLFNAYMSCLFLFFPPVVLSTPNNKYATITNATVSKIIHLIAPVIPSVSKLRKKYG